MLALLSDPAGWHRHGHLLSQHLLGCGMPVSRIEARFVLSAPPLAFRTKRTQPKLVSTRTLADSEIGDVYSELMALNI